MLSVDFIRFTKGNGAIVNEMKFSSQPIYSIPTENSIINTIKSSRTTGRLFMGAKDGCLYEFFYQNQAGWFDSQTKRVNLSHSKFHYFVPSFFNFNDADSIQQIELDETRNVLYTRSENSTIQVICHSTAPGKQKLFKNKSILYDKGVLFGSQRFGDVQDQLLDIECHRKQSSLLNQVKFMKLIKFILNLMFLRSFISFI